MDGIMLGGARQQIHRFRGEEGSGLSKVQRQIVDYISVHPGTPGGNCERFGIGEKKGLL